MLIKRMFLGLRIMVSSKLRYKKKSIKPRARTFKMKAQWEISWWNLAKPYVATLLALAVYG